ncbi:alpha/beta hydrolase, partial [Lysobacter sp. 2RAB21]
ALDIGPGAAGQLRWRRTDGLTGALIRAGKDRWTSTYGWTERPDGHALTIDDCGRGGIRFDDMAGQREALIQRDTRFESNGVELAGRLTLPPGRARVPIVVLIHGAEHSSA